MFLRFCCSFSVLPKVIITKGIFFTLYSAGETWVSSLWQFLRGWIHTLPKEGFFLPGKVKPAVQIRVREANILT